MLQADRVEKCLILQSHYTFLIVLFNSNLLYKVGLFWKLGTASDVKRVLLTLYFYNKNSKAHFQ